MGSVIGAGTVLVANPSADLYGSDRMMLEAVGGLVTLGWRVVVTCSDDGPLIEPLREAGAEVQIMSVPVIRKSMLSPRGLIGLAGQAARSVFSMRRLVRAVRPDVVLVNTLTIPLWLVVARWCRVPAAVHVHEAESSLARVSRFALTAPLALATRVIYNSEVSRQVSRVGLLERQGRTRVIHNGVSGPPAAEPARSRLDAPMRLIYVGRLSPRKGVDLVIRAARVLADQDDIAVTVALVGSVFPGYEWYELELRELIAQLNLDGQVTFHGFQPTVWPFLADADVAVVPSRLDESFGNTVIEALLAARPVVVSDHTGLREAAEGFEAAVLTPTDDVTGLVSGLRAVNAQWGAYRARAERDADRAQERYGPQRFRRALASALSEMFAAERLPTR